MPFSRKDNVGIRSSMNTWNPNDVFFNQGVAMHQKLMRRSVDPGRVHRLT